MTQLLRASADGDSSARERLMEIVYERLRAIARQRMAGERRDHTLQATALVHEAYARLLGKEGVEWAGRGHFFHAAAEAMRKILIDHARARMTSKRGGARAALSLSGIADLADERNSDGILAFDEAIERLEKVDAQAAAVVRLRFYAGLTVEATAEALGLSERTTRRDWAFARAWLKEAIERELTGDE